jgi:peptidoglycan/LPS O-acetylase OafA/YrhL
LNAHSIESPHPITPPTATASADGRLVERRLTSLDGWRGLAILLVFARHYFLTSNVHSFAVLFAVQIASTGWIGVDLFFVLSGFLITGILLDTRGHKRYFRNFYMRRTLRIFPLFYGVLLLALALTPVLHLQWQRGDIAHFLYVGNIATRFNPSLVDIKPWLGLDATWSLAVEEQFYLVWPITVLWIADRRPLRWIAAFMTAALLLRVILLALLPREHAVWWSYEALPMRADGLLCGAAAAILFRSGTLAEALRRIRWPAMISAAILAAILVQEHRLQLGSVSTTILLLPCLGILFAWLLLTTLLPGSWAYKIGSTRWLRFFGRYSYGMYIFHRLINSDGMLHSIQLHTHSQVLGGVLYVLAVFALTTAAAVLSYELYESRFLKLKRKFSYSAEIGSPAGS